MRLIDKDALIEEAESGGWDVDIKELQMILKYVPTIDAVPVVRGEWVVDECDSTDDVPSYSWICFHCSECSTDYGLEEGQYGWYRCDKIPYNYCPNCGAKMEDKP